MLNFSTDEILKRLRKLASVETNKELALKIDINEKTLAGWKSRNSFPMEMAISFAEQFNVSLDWLIKGKEQTALNTHEKMALLAFNDLDERQKIDALAFMSGLKNGSSSGVNVDQSHNNGGLNSFVGK